MVQSKLFRGQLVEYNVESLGTHNQISYSYFCALGGLAHPRTVRRERTNGSQVYVTYHLYKLISVCRAASTNAEMLEAARLKFGF